MLNLAVYSARAVQILAYAQYLGMDVEEDADLLFVAEWALAAPVPVRVFFERRSPLNQLAPAALVPMRSFSARICMHKQT